jgi:hypothetical protein
MTQSTQNEALDQNNEFDEQNQDDTEVKLTEEQARDVMQDFE